MDIKLINHTRYLKFFLFTYFFLLIGCSSRSSDVLVAPENFHQVSAQIYRSGQPTYGEMKWLELQGIKTIIKLVAPENFHQVSAQIYRSGQPTYGEMKWLELQGIKTIINLRQYHSDNDDAEGTQLTIFQVRMNANNITNSDVIEVLRKINSTSEPVLVHCWHGSDRTGTIIAMYRLVFENWTKE